MRNTWKEVLKRLKAHGLRVKRNKCTFFQSSIEWMQDCRWMQDCIL